MTKIQEMINKGIEKIKDKKEPNERIKEIQSIWDYKHGNAYWTNARLAIRIEVNKEYDGFSDKLYFADPLLADRYTKMPDVDRIMLSSLDSYHKLDVALPDFALNAEFFQIDKGKMYLIDKNGKYIEFPIDIDKKISMKAKMMYYKFVKSLDMEVYVSDKGYNIYACGRLKDSRKIEAVFAPLVCEKFNEETEETEEEMQEEVESERQTNEETAESLNDRHEEAKQEEIQEEEQEELPDDADVYDIVFNYLVTHSCTPTSNGSGGLNIDCPYQKKDIVKSLGAMWSPRYYRWYIRADRLEKAANIIKKLA